LIPENVALYYPLSYNHRNGRHPILRKLADTVFQMSVDIRRMSKEELNALNESGRAWRERDKLARDQPAPETVPIPTVQMDLWGKENNEL
jgi:hypothetical protein